VRNAPSLRRGASGAAVLAVLLAAVVLAGLWHVTQGTSGVGSWDLLRYLLGAREDVGGVPITDVLTGSRLPRVLADYYARVAERLEARPAVDAGVSPA